MTEIEAILARHSVRSYQNKKIEPDKVKLLNEKIAQLNKQGNLNLQFIENAGKTYNKLLNKALGLGSAPSVIACVGAEAEDLEERIGYYGQQLVLYAQQLGLNTCWAGIFNKNAIPAKTAPGERIVISIAIGYGVNAGKARKSRTIDQVSSCSGERPEWFDYAVEMALLAPTAMNQQKFEISCQEGKVIFKDKGGLFSKVDLGIVKYNFSVGAAAKQA